MSTPKHTILILLISLVSLASSDRLSRGANSPQSIGAKRIRFDVSTFEERNGQRDLVSETTIEGREGTDFTIKLNGARFQMKARFLTDLISPNALNLRADLNTRRFYGKSERDLPLYEEDSQSETVQLSFDEKLVLLPFGRTATSDQLKIEITPTLTDRPDYLESEQRRPLEIKILKASPGGAISVEATKVPHKFTVEAALMEDGREVARDTSELSLEEPIELMLKPAGQARREVIDHPLAVRLSVIQYMRSRPVDQVSTEFDVHQSNEPAPPQPPILQGAGINELGADSNYDLSDYYLKSSGRKYELRFRVKLAAGEHAN